MFLACAIATVLVAAPQKPGRFTRFNSRAETGRSGRGLQQAATSSGGSSFTPLFSFAPSGGAGLGSDCACPASVTDATGNVTMTHTRSSAALCVSGQTFAECDANEPRIQGGGYLMEASAINRVLRNEEIDNAVWYKIATGSPGVPTVTAGQADPLGGTTAERVQIDACPTSGHYAVIGQNYSLDGPVANSVWLKGNGADCQIGMVQLGTGTDTLVVCNITNGVWSRCTGTHSGAVITEIDYGCWNHGSVSGATNTGACDFFMWRPQTEDGLVHSSAIKTVAAAVTRSADSQLSGTLASPFAAGSFCLGASVQRTTTASFSSTSFVVLKDSSNDVFVSETDNTTLSMTANSSNTTPTVAAIGTTLRRLIWGATSTWDGTSLSPVPTATSGQTNTAILIGTPNAILSDVVLATSGCQ